MTAKTERRAVNCTQCGAGLSIFGGGRIRAIACEYCGAVLDTRADLAILAHYIDMPRPDSPFEIGAKGRIGGIDFEITGTLGMEERYRGETWTWTEHQIFSPTHGYAWISWEEGYALFTRKVRTVPRPFWIGSYTVERADNRPVAYLPRPEPGGMTDHRFVYYATTTASVVSVFGAFNWVPRRGDTATTVDLASSDGEMLGFTESKDEREYELSRLLTAEEAASFGVTVSADPSLHVLGPRATYTPGLAEAIRWPALAFSIIAVAGGLMMDPVTRTEIFATEDIPLTQPSSHEFTVENIDQLYEFWIETPVYNAWVYFDASLVNDEDEVMAEFGREVGYYYGTDSDGGWSEGSHRSGATFRLPEPGTYAIEVEATEQGAEFDGIEMPTAYRVGLDHGINATRWMYLTGVALLVLFGLSFIFGGPGRDKRWAGSDWDDD